MHLQRFALAALMIALVGCVRVSESENKPLPQVPATTPPPERQGEPIQTDALVYTLRKAPGIYDATAVATYTNSSNKPVYFNRCMGEDSTPVHYVNRAPPHEEVWSVVGSVWACVGGVPRGEVLPGGTLTVEVWLGSTDSPNANPPHRPEERSGRFRVVFELFSQPGTNDEYGAELSLRERQSNVFDLRLPE